MPAPDPLTLPGLARAARALGRRDPDLGRVIDAHGVPPLWDRPTGFPTLILIILEQQVSLASARAAYHKLVAACGAVTPEAFLSFDDAALKQFGFSRQKIGYGRAMAERILAGSFHPEALEGMGDDAARAALVSLKGIGVWTADIYLLMALRRPDIWPHGDLALVKAAQTLKGISRPVTRDDWETLAEPWRPYRSVAARILWHHYLSK